MIQAGPKSQLGGVNPGFYKAAYQEGMAERVKTAPRIPASWHAATLARSFTQFIYFVPGAGFSMPSSSTSKIRVALGPMTWPAPCSP